MLSLRPIQHPAKLFTAWYPAQLKLKRTSVVVVSHIVVNSTYLSVRLKERMCVSKIHHVDDSGSMTVIKKKKRKKRHGGTLFGGEKLAARMQKIINGELLAIASIPLAASLMARGVAYQDTMPWQVRP